MKKSDFKLLLFSSFLVNVINYTAVGKARGRHFLVVYLGEVSSLKRELSNDNLLREVLKTKVQMCLALCRARLKDPKQGCLVSSLLSYQTLIHQGGQRYITQYLEVSILCFFNPFQSSETLSFSLECLLCVLPSSYL